MELYWMPYVKQRKNHQFSQQTKDEKSSHEMEDTLPGHDKSQQSTDENGTARKSDTGEEKPPSDSKDIDWETAAAIKEDLRRRSRPDVDPILIYSSDDDLYIPAEYAKHQTKGKTEKYPGEHKHTSDRYKVEDCTNYERLKRANANKRDSKTDNKRRCDDIYGDEQTNIYKKRNFSKSDNPDERLNYKRLMEHNAKSSETESVNEIGGKRKKLEVSKRKSCDNTEKSIKVSFYEIHKYEFADEIEKSPHKEKQKKEPQTILLKDKENVHKVDPKKSGCDWVKQNKKDSSNETLERTNWSRREEKKTKQFKMVLSKHNKDEEKITDSKKSTHDTFERNKRDSKTTAGPSNNKSIIPSFNDHKKDGDEPTEKKQVKDERKKVVEYKTTVSKEKPVEWEQTIEEEIKVLGRNVKNQAQFKSQKASSKSSQDGVARCDDQQLIAKKQFVEEEVEILMQNMMMQGRLNSNSRQQRRYSEGGREESKKGNVFSSSCSPVANIAVSTVENNHHDSLSDYAVAKNHPDFDLMATKNATDKPAENNTSDQSFKQNQVENNPMKTPVENNPMESSVEDNPTDSSMKNNVMDCLDSKAPFSRRRLSIMMNPEVSSGDALDSMSDGEMDEVSRRAAEELRLIEDDCSTDEERVKRCIKEEDDLLSDEKSEISRDDENEFGRLNKIEASNDTFNDESVALNNFYEPVESQFDESGKKNPEVQSVVSGDYTDESSNEKPEVQSVSNKHAGESEKEIQTKQYEEETGEAWAVNVKAEEDYEEYQVIEIEESNSGESWFHQHDSYTQQGLLDGNIHLVENVLRCGNSEVLSGIGGRSKIGVAMDSSNFVIEDQQNSGGGINLGINNSVISVGINSTNINVKTDEKDKEENNSRISTNNLGIRPEETEESIHSSYKTGDQINSFSNDKTNSNDQRNSFLNEETNFSSNDQIKSLLNDRTNSYSNDQINTFSKDQTNLFSINQKDVFPKETNDQINSFSNDQKNVVPHNSELRHENDETNKITVSSFETTGERQKSKINPSVQNYTDSVEICEEIPISDSTVIYVNEEIEIPEDFHNKQIKKERPENLLKKLLRMENYQITILDNGAFFEIVRPIIRIICSSLRILEAMSMCDTTDKDEEQKRALEEAVENLDVVLQKVDVLDFNIGDVFMSFNDVKERNLSEFCVDVVLLLGVMHKPKTSFGKIFYLSLLEEGKKVFALKQHYFEALKLLRNYGAEKVIVLNAIFKEDKEIVEISDDDEEEKNDKQAIRDTITAVPIENLLDPARKLSLISSPDNISKAGKGIENTQEGSSLAENAQIEQYPLDAGHLWCSQSLSSRGLPTQNFIPQGSPSHGIPTQSFLPQGSPQNLPSQALPTGSFLPQESPSRGLQTQSFLPQGSPSQVLPTGSLLPQESPSQVLPTQSFLPQGSPSQVLPTQSFLPQGSPSQVLPTGSLLPQESPSQVLPTQSFLPQGSPSQNLPSQALPTGSFLPQGSPSRVLPTQSFLPQGSPSRVLPTRSFLPQGLHTQNLSSHGLTPQSIPPQRFSPPGIPPQRFSPPDIHPQGFSPPRIPPQPFSPPGIPPRRYPSQGFRPEGIPSRSLPSQCISPQSFKPPKSLPSQGILPQSSPSHGLTAQSMSRQEIPPRSLPSQGIPPQSSPPSQGTSPQSLPSHLLSPQSFPSQGLSPQRLPSHELTSQSMPSHWITPQCIPSKSVPPQRLSSEGTSQQCLPPRGFLSQGLPPSQSVPPRSLAPQGFPPHSLPPQGFPSHGFPSQGCPPRSLPPQGLLSHSLTPRSLPSQSFHPQGLPPSNPNSQISQGNPDYWRNQQNAQIQAVNQSDPVVQRPPGYPNENSRPNDFHRISEGLSNQNHFNAQRPLSPRSQYRIWSKQQDYSRIPVEEYRQQSCSNAYLSSRESVVPGTPHPPMFNAGLRRNFVRTAARGHYPSMGRGYQNPYVKQMMPQQQFQLESSKNARNQNGNGGSAGLRNARGRLGNNARNIPASSLPSIAQNSQEHQRNTPVASYQNTLALSTSVTSSAQQNYSVSSAAQQNYSVSSAAQQNHSILSSAQQNRSILSSAQQNHSISSAAQQNHSILSNCSISPNTQQNHSIVLYSQSVHPNVSNILNEKQRASFCNPQSKNSTDFLKTYLQNSNEAQKRQSLSAGQCPNVNPFVFPQSKTTIDTHSNAAEKTRMNSYPEQPRSRNPVAVPEQPRTRNSVVSSTVPSRNPVASSTVPSRNPVVENTTGLNSSQKANEQFSFPELRNHLNSGPTTGFSLNGVPRISRQSHLGSPTEIPKTTISSLPQSTSENQTSQETRNENTLLISGRQTSDQITDNRNENQLLFPALQTSSDHQVLTLPTSTPESPSSLPQEESEPRNADENSSPLIRRLVASQSRIPDSSTEVQGLTLISPPCQTPSLLPENPGDPLGNKLQRSIFQPPQENRVVKTSSLSRLNVQRPSTIDEFENAGLNLKYQNFTKYIEGGSLRSEQPEIDSETEQSLIFNKNASANRRVSSGEENNMEVQSVRTNINNQNLLTSALLENTPNHNLTNKNLLTQTTNQDVTNVIVPTNEKNQNFNNRTLLQKYGINFVEDSFPSDGIENKETLDAEQSDNRQKEHIPQSLKLLPLFQTRPKKFDSTRTASDHAELNSEQSNCDSVKSMKQSGNARRASPLGKINRFGVALNCDIQKESNERGNAQDVPMFVFNGEELTEVSTQRNQKVAETASEYYKVESRANGNERILRNELNFKNTSIASKGSDLSEEFNGRKSSIVSTESSAITTISSGVIGVPARIAPITTLPVRSSPVTTVPASRSPITSIPAKSSPTTATTSRFSPIAKSSSIIAPPARSSPTTNRNEVYCKTNKPSVVSKQSNDNEVFYKRKSSLPASSKNNSRIPSPSSKNKPSPGTLGGGNRVSLNNSSAGRSKESQEMSGGKPLSMPLLRPSGDDPAVLHIPDNDEEVSKLMGAFDKHSDIARLIENTGGKSGNSKAGPAKRGKIQRVMSTDSGCMLSPTLEDDRDTPVAFNSGST